MLMYDPEFKGMGGESKVAYFFELDWLGFIKKIRDDVNSFFGFPDGCPEDKENAIIFRSMWRQLRKNKEYAEHGRRVAFVRGSAIVK